MDVVQQFLVGFVALAERVVAAFSLRRANQHFALEQGTVARAVSLDNLGAGYEGAGDVGLGEVELAQPRGGEWGLEVVGGAHEVRAVADFAS